MGRFVLFRFCEPLIPAFCCVGLVWCLTSCKGQLAKEDITNLHNIQVLTYLSYQRGLDAGSPTSAMDRAVFCSAEAVLRHQDAGLLDTKGQIVCQRVAP